MIRSLFAGVSGVKSHQTRMDVVGNNIANTNTVAYKRQRATFNQVLGQQFVGIGRSGGGASINPAQIGLGVTVGSIDQNFTQGALEYTGNSTDLALNGDGFFIVKDHRGTPLLTRAGNFTFNEDGALVTTTGHKVQGWPAGVAGAPTDVEVDFSRRSAAEATTEITVRGNLSSDAADGDSSPISTIVYDEQGKPHSLLITIEKVTDNQWSYTVSPADAAADPQPFSTVSGTLDFNVDGSLATAPAITVDWDANFVTGGSPLTLDLGELTQVSGSNTAGVREQNGKTSGELIGFSIGQTGVLALNFSNGHQEELFQLAIGNVNNPNGLERGGENLYGLTSETGDLTIGRAGKEFRATIAPGSLEMSNVDLSTEFADMIVTQRGYQASARVVTTSDELLQELIQMKR